MYCVGVEPETVKKPDNKEEALFVEKTKQEKHRIRFMQTPPGPEESPSGRKRTTAPYSETDIRDDILALSRLLRRLGGVGKTRYLSEAFGDFVRLARAALANSVYFSREIEEEYMRIAKGYDRHDLEIMAQLLGELIVRIQKRPSDLLGGLYMYENLGKGRAGQFFTPYNVSVMTAKITFDAKTLLEAIESKGWASVADPAVGAGGMLIATWESARDAGIDPMEKVWFYGMDIDDTCAAMTYIQLSALGAAATVVTGNCITGEKNRMLHTPAALGRPWRERLFAKERSEERAVG